MGERDFMLRPVTMLEIELLVVEVSGIRWLRGWFVVVLRLRANFGLLVVFVLLLLLVVVVVVDFVVVRLIRFCWTGGCFMVVVDEGLMTVSDCLFMIVVRFEPLLDKISKNNLFKI